jgi:hypothetical protein
LNDQHSQIMRISFGNQAANVFGRLRGAHVGNRFLIGKLDTENAAATWQDVMDHGFIPLTFGACGCSRR